MNQNELKKKYKQTLPQMGVFQIKNSVNGKIFIGCSKNIKGKLNSIKFQLEMGSYINKELQEDFNKYGEKEFIFETIDTLEPKDDSGYNYNDDLFTLEGMWLEKLLPYGLQGYNKKK